MKRLDALHQGLARVGRFRTLVRLGSAWSVFVSVALWILLVAFGLDVLTHMGILERIVTVAIGLIILVFTFKRFLIPVMGVRESQVQLALLVEGRQGVNTDFVAALQFSDEARKQFGSEGLREAIVSYTDAMSPNINYLEGFSRRQLFNRGMFMVITVVIAMLPVVAFGDHVAAFLNRLALGNAMYPTNTIIQEIVSPGEKLAFGQPVHFKVKVAGDLPESGRVRITAVTSGIRSELKLVKDQNDESMFAVTLDRLTDDLTYQIFLGDAYTHPREIKQIPLPVVKVEYETETPSHAANRFSARSVDGRRSIVLEGSRVMPILVSDKPLRSASMTIDETTYDLKKDSARGGLRWVLDAKGNPFESVEQTIHWEAQVEDTDGVSLERPISGVLQVRADQPPAVAAIAVTRRILPNAEPTVVYKVVDDYAISKLVARILVQPGPMTLEADADAKPLIHTKIIARPEKHDDTIEGRVGLNFSGNSLNLKLLKGDRVMVAFEATDYRGEGKAGKVTVSEQLVFEVTDQNGIIEALQDLPTQIDKKLDQIIRAQQGIGDRP